MENDLSRAMDSSEMKRQYDEVCKTLLSNKQILARILKECVEEFKDCDLRDIIDNRIEGTPQISRIPVSRNETIKGLNTDDSTITEGEVTYDILFEAVAPGTNERIELIINLEAQKHYYPGYPLISRAVYYCSRLISAQKGRYFDNSNYQDIRKVYSIWICTSPPKEAENTITEYKITKKDLVGVVREDESSFDLMRVLMLRLGKRNEELRSKILEFLNLLLTADEPKEDIKEKLTSEHNISFDAETETEVLRMCNLSEGLWERAMTRGRTEGKAEGKIEGRAEGKIEGRAEGVQALINAMKAAGMDTSEVEKLKV